MHWLVLATDRWRAVITFTIYTIPNVAGLVLMKYSLTGARDAWQVGLYFDTKLVILLIGGCLYVLGFLVWLVILASFELSQAYPVAIGLTLAFSTLASILVLGESLSFSRAIGIAVIYLGIWLVAR